MSTISEESTIVAVATPPGRGGVGVVRLSGPHAFRIVTRLFPGENTFSPRYAHYRVLRDSSEGRIDDALITCFPAPNSYTGEDVVEIATHGSPVVLDWLVRTCVQYGAVPARAGEFTERAFLSRRLDLTAAEAVRDLIEAQTLTQARQAAEQMAGSIATAVRPAKQTLLGVIAALEAGIDFAEDDIDTIPADDLTRRISALEPPLAALLASFAHGRLLREGLRLAIVGRPNVGKSSLFNRLVKHERAIVTAIPGTTRDVIAERISLDGVPVELLDTAGLRETGDEAERMGVLRSRQATAEADAVLVVIDATEPDSGGVLDELAPLLRGRPVLIVHNKIDLLPIRTAEEPQQRSGKLEAESHTLTGVYPDAPGLKLPVEGWHIVKTSTVTGAGLDNLRKALLALVTSGAQNAGGAALTNLRQRDTVSRAHAAMQRAAAAAALSTPHEMILLDLYEALRALDEVTGETTPDDVLNLIFSTFCIGK